MMTKKLDSSGRLFLGKKLRDKYGDKFILIESTGSIVLRPVLAKER